MKWIDNIPLVLLVFIAFFMAIIPLHPESHLLEKSKMLLAGTLIKPIDIFDLFMHVTPTVLLVIRLSRLALNKSAPKADDKNQS